MFSTSLFAQVKPGIHQIEKYVPLLTSKNVAVVGNHSSQFETPTGRIHLVDSLLRHEIRIVNVFAPIEAAILASAAVKFSPVNPLNAV